MVDKITLQNLTSGYQSVAQLNANLQLIEDALNNEVLYRDNPTGTTNTMSNELDMNSNRIRHLPSPDGSDDAARWVDVTDYVGLTGQAVPSLTSNSDKYISNDGTSLVWRSPGEIYVCTDSGTASTYVLTTTASRNAPTAWRTGQVFVFKPATTNSANSGVSTITVYDAVLATSLATKSLKYQGSALSASWLSTSNYYVCVYDGTDVQIIASSKLQTGMYTADSVTLAELDGDATFAHKLIGYDASGDPANVTSYMRLLASGSVSAAASFTIPFTSDTGATGNKYLIRVHGIIPANGDVELYAQLIDENSATISTNSYTSMTIGSTSSGSAAGTSASKATTAATSQATILGSSAAGDSLGTAAGASCSFEMIVHGCNQGATALPTILGYGSYTDHGGDLCAQTFSFKNSTADEYRGIIFTLESGNFEAAGTWQLFKIA